MTPHYDWTPASEPPDSERVVLVWGYYTDRPEEPAWLDWVYVPQHGWADDCMVVTHWRDVEAPTCKDGLQVEGQDDEERFTLRQVSNACIAVEIEESKYESLLLELDSLKWKDVEAPET